MTPAYRKGLADPLCTRWPGSASQGLSLLRPARAKYARSDPHRQPRLWKCGFGIDNLGIRKPRLRPCEQTSGPHLTVAIAACSRSTVCQFQGGSHVYPSKTTVFSFLESWIEHMRSQISPKSHARYSELARKNIAPLLGSVVLTKLKPAAISSAYAKALTEGRRKGGGGLSPQTVTHMHRVLKLALPQAVKWELIARNPADAVDPPKTTRGLMNTYDLDQTAELIAAMRPTRMLIPTLLAVLCGMCRGEVAALRWRSVILATGQLAIVESAEQIGSKVRYKSPKSGKGRTLALSASLVIRLSDDTFVVAQVDGSPLQPDTLTQDWVRKLANTSLPRVRFHERSPQDRQRAAGAF
jgi:integrase